MNPLFEEKVWALVVFLVFVIRIEGRDAPISSLFSPLRPAALAKFWWNLERELTADFACDRGENKIILVELSRDSLLSFFERWDWLSLWL